MEGFRQAQNTGSHRKLAEAREDSPLESLEGAWPRGYLEFSLATYRIVRAKISVVSHQVCSNLLWEP